jgi:hypothetical protein
MGEKINPRDHIGEVHGIYTIEDMLDKKDKHGHWIYKCVCNECGFVRFCSYGSVSAPSSITKTCKHKRVNGHYLTFGRIWQNKRIKNIFSGMVARCYDENDKNYRWYGAKNIEVCRDWLDNPLLFEQWALENGYADNLTIDRINADQDYCPENCRWIPLEENVRRAGKVTWIEIEGNNMTGRQWADYLQLGTNTINTAIRKHGIDKTKELIRAMIKDPPLTKQRKSHQTWFSVYGIQV